MSLKLDQIGKTGSLSPFVGSKRHWSKWLKNQRNRKIRRQAIGQEKIKLNQYKFWTD